jgi:hypothetical protein
MWTTHMDSKKMLGIPLSSSILGWIMWIFFGVNISWLTIKIRHNHHTKKVPAGCSYCESLAFFFHLGFWYTRGYWGCNLLRLILGFIICYADRRWCLERNECIELLLALLLGKIVDHLNDDIFRKIIGGCLKMGDTIHTLIKIAIQIEKNWKIHRMIHGVL